MTASAKTRLTKKEISVLIDILSERLAGGQDDFADAFGMTESEAEEAIQYAESALKKLIRRPR